MALRCRMRDKPYSLRVHQIGEVQHQIGRSEHGDHQLAVPRALSSRTVSRSPRGSVLLVETKHGPDHGSAQIQKHRQEGVDDHEAVEREA